MGRTVTFTKAKKDEFIKLFIHNNFHLSLTCDELGMSTYTYYTAMMNDEAFKQKVNLYKDVAKGLIDNALLKGVNDPDPLVSVKFLDLIGKNKSFQGIFNIETSEADSITFKLTKEDFID